MNGRGRDLGEESTANRRANEEGSEERNLKSGRMRRGPPEMKEKKREAWPGAALKLVRGLGSNVVKRRRGKRRGWEIGT